MNEETAAPVCAWTEPLPAANVRADPSGIQNAYDVMVVGGGIIPEEDIPKLKKLGIKEIFLPGTSLDAIVNWVKDNVKPRC